MVRFLLGGFALAAVVKRREASESQPEKLSVTSNERLCSRSNEGPPTDQGVEWGKSCSVSLGGARTCKCSACVRRGAENGLPDEEQQREKAG